MTIHDHDPHPVQFDLALCLDFANADCCQIGSSTPEALAHYGDLVAWGHDAGLLSDRQADHLFDIAKYRPVQAANVLQQAIDLQGAVARIFIAVADQSMPESADLTLLNSMVIEAQYMRRLTFTDDGFVWQWLPDEDRLDRMLWPVALSTVELLTSDRLVRVKQCASETCGWLFLDGSRNRSRRWCDMSDCGNRAKARAFYERSRGNSE